MSDTDSSIRAFLLREVLCFVKYAATCHGVRRVAIVGSLTSSKFDPKDADLLVTVDADADLAPLAAGSRVESKAETKARISFLPTHPATISAGSAIGASVGPECEWHVTRDIVGAALIFMTTLMISRLMRRSSQLRRLSCGQRLCAVLFFRQMWRCNLFCQSKRTASSLIRMFPDRTLDQAVCQQQRRLLAVDCRGC